MEWLLPFSGYSSKAESFRETLCTLGNGYFATRGAAEEVSSDSVHYPGTYLAGGYNRLRSEINGLDLEHEDLVNLPNWLPLTFRPDDGEWLHPNTHTILDWNRELDLLNGLLTRTILVRDSMGRETRLVFRRFVSLVETRVAGIEMTINPQNWAGRISVRSALDGRVTNTGVQRYKNLAAIHLSKTESDKPSPETISLVTRTNQSNITIVFAARTRVFKNLDTYGGPRHTVREAAYIADHIEMHVAPNQGARVEKIVALIRSSKEAHQNCQTAAVSVIQEAPNFRTLAVHHASAWNKLWDICDIQLSGHKQIQNVLRLHTFHLFQTFSPKTQSLDVSVPARGLHGEAYRGHIFWDEVFILPFFLLREPRLARTILLYRYRRLNEARAAARCTGYAGAMFPWQSGSTGREESPRLHLNPESGRWIRDSSYTQRHVNIAVAYNLWQYWESSRDTRFLFRAGAEMFLDIAKFWASVSTYNPYHQRYEICGVMGPDEYHEHYPASREPGLRNNAYTNVMVVWLLNKALELLALLPRKQRAILTEKLHLDDKDYATWNDIAHNIRVEFHGDQIISQFEGFGNLKEFDWPRYRTNYEDIRRLDRILESENDSTNNYQVLKQPDVLMLFYLLSLEQVIALFRQIGYVIDRTTIEKNIFYYLERTSHGSTLSKVIHAWVLAPFDLCRSWRLFAESLESDTQDRQGSTTGEGIHTGVMAATIGLVQHRYVGLRIRKHRISFSPLLPVELSGDIAFRFRHLANRFLVRANRQRLTVSLEPGTTREGVVIDVFGNACLLHPGRPRTFLLREMPLTSAKH